jgi:hypothetical protein
MAARPPPLTGAELARLWHWERGMRRYYIAACAGLALAVLAIMYSDSVYVRRSMLVLVLGLVVAAAVLQSREKCPRCGARLRFRSSLILPDLCRACGVLFPRPPPEAEG